MKVVLCNSEAYVSNETMAELVSVLLKRDNLEDMRQVFDFFYEVKDSVLPECILTGKGKMAHKRTGSCSRCPWAKKIKIKKHKKARKLIKKYYASE